MQHYQEIREHFQPVGPPLPVLVRVIALSRWLFRRLFISSLLALALLPVSPALGVAAGSGWESLGRYLHQFFCVTDRFSTVEHCYDLSQFVRVLFFFPLGF